MIDSRAIHEALALLIEHLPPAVSLAIASRSDPPLRLARLRSHGELLEVRAADIRFTGEEAETFLNQLMGLRLSPAQLAVLAERTEGWAAGL